MDSKENGMNEPVFSWEELLDRTFDDEKFARQLLDIFTGRFPDQLQDLKIAFDNKEFEAIANLAHSIKGSAVNLTANILSGVAFEIEKAAKADDSESITTLIDRLEAEYEKLTAVLSNL